MIGITIPKKLSRIGDLVLIPKKDLESLIERARDVVGEKDVIALVPRSPRLEARRFIANSP